MGGQWRVGEMGKKTKLIFKIWVFGENVELGFYKNLTWVFFSSFAVLVWTVWHHRHRRSGFALPVCYLKMELIFPLLVAFCRLSSLPLVGLTSRSWMCWMKIAGDWPSLTLANFSALFFWLFFSGLWCLPFMFAPLSLSQMQWFKELALLSFNLKLLSKIHISEDSVSFSSVEVQQEGMGYS